MAFKLAKLPNVQIADRTCVWILYVIKHKLQCSYDNILHSFIVTVASWNMTKVKYTKSFLTMNKKGKVIFWFSIK